MANIKDAFGLLFSSLQFLILQNTENVFDLVFLKTMIDL